MLLLNPDERNTEKTNFILFCWITWKILKHIHSKNPTVFLKHQRGCEKNINKKTEQKTPNKKKPDKVRQPLRN